MSLFALIAVAAVLQEPAPQQPPPTATEMPPVTVTGTPIPAPAAPTDPAATPEDPMDRVTCRSEPVVGSRFNSRVCMTRREWARRREDSQDLARRLDTQNSNRGRVYAPTTGGFD